MCGLADAYLAVRLDSGLRLGDGVTPLADTLALGTEVGSGWACFGLVHGALGSSLGTRNSAGSGINSGVSMNIDMPPYFFIVFWSPVTLRIVSCCGLLDRPPFIWCRSAHGAAVGRLGMRPVHAYDVHAILLGTIGRATQRQTILQIWGSKSQNAVMTRVEL